MGSLAEIEAVVITFKTASDSIRAEQLLQPAGVEAVVLPRPASIRAGCGVCLRFPPGDLERARAVLLQEKVPVERWLARSLWEGRRCYLPLEEALEIPSQPDPPDPPKL